MNLISKQTLILQLDYIKILIEDSKFYDVHEKLDELNENIETLVKNRLETENISEGNLTKGKIGKEVYLNDIDCYGKYTDNNILKLTKNIEINVK